jgi:CheY-like chemotaxis protein
MKTIPIIAMTANVMPGDREKCLDAGADDYLSKPLKKEKLLSMVGKWIDAPTQPLAVSVLPTDKKEPDPEGAPIDYARALEEFDNDAAFLREVMAGFLENVTGQLNTVHKAVADRDFEVVASESHSIKGGASNLTADAMARVAADLEVAGKSRSLNLAAENIDKLAKELQRLEKFVETLDSSMPKGGNQ